MMINKKQEEKSNSQKANEASPLLTACKRGVQILEEWELDKDPSSKTSSPPATRDQLPDPFHQRHLLLLDQIKLKLEEFAF